MTRDHSLLGIVLIAVAAVLVVGVVVAIVEDDEPTQVQAEEQFCDDVGAYLAALGALRDVDVNTPIEEFEDARDDVLTTYENMITSGQQVRDVRLDEFQAANEAFREAVDDIDDEATFQEARDSIRDEAEEVSVQLSQVLNDVNCGSGQGAQENSDE